MNDFKARTGFKDIDNADDPEMFVEYLDKVSSTDAALMYKPRSYDLLETRKGHSILDIGCGTGEDVREIAKLVGGEATVVGLDRSAVMIAAARARTKVEDHSVHFSMGDVHRLSFRDETFNSCRADRTLMHLAEPQLALHEMLRVTKHKGRLVVIEPDWETLVVDSRVPTITRHIVNHRCDRIRNGWVGRKLYSFFKQALLTEVNVETFTMVFTDFKEADLILSLRKAAWQACSAGSISRNETNDWVSELTENAAKGLFFSGLTFYMLSGRKAR